MKSLAPPKQRHWLDPQRQDFTDLCVMMCCRSCLSLRHTRSGPIPLGQQRRHRRSSCPSRRPWQQVLFCAHWLHHPSCQASAVSKLAHALQAELLAIKLQVQVRASLSDAALGLAQAHMPGSKPSPPQVQASGGGASAEQRSGRRRQGRARPPPPAASARSACRSGRTPS